MNKRLSIDKLRHASDNVKYLGTLSNTTMEDIISRYLVPSHDGNYGVHQLVFVTPRCPAQST